MGHIRVSVRVHNGYTSRMVRKDVAFKLRIDEVLRRAFVEACRAEDRPAAQVVREFMRTNIEKHRPAMSAGRLFEPETIPKQSDHKRRREV